MCDRNRVNRVEHWLGSGTEVNAEAKRRREARMEDGILIVSVPVPTSSVYTMSKGALRSALSNKTASASGRTKWRSTFAFIPPASSARTSALRYLWLDQWTHRQYRNSATFVVGFGRVGTGMAAHNRLIRSRGTSSCHTRIYPVGYTRQPNDAGWVWSTQSGAFKLIEVSWPESDGTSMGNNQSLLRICLTTADW